MSQSRGAGSQLYANDNDRLVYHLLRGGNQTLERQSPTVQMPVQLGLLANEYLILFVFVPADVLEGHTIDFAVTGVAERQQPVKAQARRGPDVKRLVLPVRQPGGKLPKRHEQAAAIVSHDQRTV